MNRALTLPLLLLAACTAPADTPSPAAAPTPSQTQAPTATPPHAQARRPHAHAGAGSSSACMEGRYNGPIQLYPPDKAGDLDHKVSTANADAQRYFNQGLTFFYGFDAESAMRSFHQASVLDPKLAMAHWGIALAAGGDLNIPIDEPCVMLAGREIQQAETLGTTDEAEKDYIQALAARYPGSKLNQGSGLDVAQLGVRYALQMEILQKKYATTDPDASALHAYSLMNLRPWHWWQPAGQPTREVSAAIGVLDAALARFPNHIGLNHLKIHAVEEAPIEKASLGKPSADYLFQHAPFITPHLHHMPAHTFRLLGDWQQLAIDSSNHVEDRAWGASVPTGQGGVVRRTG